MKVRIEMTVSDDVDPSTILEAAQALAIELNEEIIELDPKLEETITAAVSVETVEPFTPEADRDRYD